MIDLDLPVLEFTANDRCDACGAQAYSLAQQDGQTDLLFCVHHRKRHYDRLLMTGWTVIDDVQAMEGLYAPV